MTISTESLVRKLAADVQPVKRLHPPTLRAALWLVAVLAAGSILVAWLADMGLFMERAHDPRQMVELAATLATGVLAIVAAFQVAMPDRSAAWAWLPLPTLLVWLATTGYGCLESWIAGVGWDPVESAECFLIMVAASVPLGVTALVLLYRARPLAPVRVAAMAGLGVAALAAFLLQFFHPFDVTIMDLAFHAAAAALIVAISAGSARVSAR